MNERLKSMQENKNSSPQEKIALFKYGIIAPILFDNAKKQTAYFKEMAQQIFEVPTIGQKKYKWQTFKSWLLIFRKDGFEGLKPKTRKDKGEHRKIDDQLANIIKEKCQSFPLFTIALQYRMLKDEGYIRHGSPCYETVRSFILNNKLKSTEDNMIPRKKFEKQHINELWVSDFVHLPGYIVEGKKQRIYLCGIIDDHSRVMTGFHFSFHENVQSLEYTLKGAIQTYGVPKKFYCDNGAAFRSEHLQLVCARLAVALIHSKPYDSPARGKIERFWRTVRQSFLPLLDSNKDYSLDKLNTLFKQWLDNGYHRKVHSSTLMTPLERYLDDMNHTQIKRIDDNELDRIFYRTYQRKVKNDATISIHSVLFEVPSRFISTSIEVRHPLGHPMDLWLFENDEPIIKLQKVDVHFNSKNTTTSGISFAKKNKE